MSWKLSKKSEEQAFQKVRDLLRRPENKKCFDCPTKSPFFVNVTVQTFICARCSGLVREVGHRVKSISASTFSGPEVVLLQQGGNEVARNIWLRGYQMSMSDPETDADVRHFIRQKYYEQKWLDRDLFKSHAERVQKMVISMFTENGERRPGVSTPPPPPVASQFSIPKPPPTLPTTHSTSCWIDSPLFTAPTPPGKTIPGVLSPSMTLLDDDTLPALSTFQVPLSPPPVPLSIATTPVSREHRASVSSSSLRRDTSSSSILDELAGLDSPRPTRTPVYTGGILLPSSPTTMAPQPLSPQSFSPSAKQDIVSRDDPYAALRRLSFGMQGLPLQTSLTPGSTHDGVFDDLGSLNQWKGSHT